MDVIPYLMRALADKRVRVDMTDSDLSVFGNVVAVEQGAILLRAVKDYNADDEVAWTHDLMLIPFSNIHDVTYPADEPADSPLEKLP